MVFVYYQYNEPPVFFNDTVKQKVYDTEYGNDFKSLEDDYGTLFDEKLEAVNDLNKAIKTENEGSIEDAQLLVNSIQAESDVLRGEAKEMIEAAIPGAETNDKDYIFMNFVMNVLPVGIVGLLFAVIFSAAMSSTSSELNALGGTTTIDFYKRRVMQGESDLHYLKSSKLFTLAWGILAIIIASTLSLFENLIQAVNLIGSLFYPTVLGIFIVAFFFKSIKSNAVFIAAIISQLLIIYIHYLNTQGTAGIFTMGFLWYNALGCLMVVVISFLLKIFKDK